MRRAAQAVPHPTRGEDLTEAAALDIESRRAALTESVSMVHRTLGRFHNLSNVHEPLPWRQQITVRAPLFLGCSRPQPSTCMHACMCRLHSSVHLSWAGGRLSTGVLHKC